MNIFSRTLNIALDFIAEKNPSTKKIIDNNVNVKVDSIKDDIRDKYGLGQVQNNINRNFFSGGGREGGAKYSHGISGSGTQLNINGFETRMNARRAVHDSLPAHAIANRFADSVVDIGIIAEPAPKASILGISEEQSEDWSAVVGERYDLWCKSKDQHRSNLLTHYQSQRLYMLSQQRDNDNFIRYYYSNDKNLINPLQFEIIEPNQIRGSEFTTTFIQPGGNDGIDRDDRGRETHYNIWIRDDKNNNGFKKITIPKIGPKSKRIFMIHGFWQEYAGQRRGFSRFHHALQDFQNMTDFKLSHIKKAINQSNLNIYVKPSKDAPASNPMEGILTDRKAGPAASQFGSNPTPSGNAQNVTADSTDPVTFCPLPEADVGIPGSTNIFNLEAGEDIGTFDNKAPSESFDKFVDNYTSYMSASMGMPLEVMLMKFNQNYSASRAALILFWRVGNIWREEMAADYLFPTYLMFLSEEIAKGSIQAPGWSDPMLKRAWSSVNWIGAPMPNIDPERTAKSDMLYASMGATHLDRIAREHNGSSFKVNKSKMKRQLDDIHIPPWTQHAQNLPGSSPGDGDE